jgi:hypothetical protein
MNKVQSSENEVGIMSRQVCGSHRHRCVGKAKKIGTRGSFVSLNAAWRWARRARNFGKKRYETCFVSLGTASFRFISLGFAWRWAAARSETPDGVSASESKSGPKHAVPWSAVARLSGLVSRGVQSVKIDVRKRLAGNGLLAKHILIQLVIVSVLALTRLSYGTHIQ